MQKQMCVNHHKSVKGCKKIATSLYLHISLVREIIKKFKDARTVWRIISKAHR